jgi:NAD(P)-dependent dehydrogenase (short-subunit alcohol dehydrogenase family)
MSTAIVTGATSGIGRAGAIALARASHWVLATGRDPERGAEVADRLAEAGAGEFLAVDLLAPDAPERLVQTAVERTGRLDVLVNNAGIYQRGTVDEISPEELDLLLATNLRAAILLTRAAVPVMRAAGHGVVINVASEAAIAAVPGQVAYNVSKAAMVMLSKSVAVDHAADGIRAVSLCPGTTRTPLVENAIRAADDPSALEELLTSIRPAGRLGTAEELGEAIVYLASAAAGYMTGSELVIDGGYTAG